MNGAKVVRPSAAERFAAMVTTTGPLPLIRGVYGHCHLWTGTRTTTGYGRFWHGRTRQAHRVAYEQAHGPIPAGLDIDHRCRNRACVRPDHLRAVTHRENILASGNHVAIAAARTSCIHGHRFTPANTRLRPNGTRACRSCDRNRPRNRTKETS